jgi:hypothetical protein
MQQIKLYAQQTTFIGSTHAKNMLLSDNVH